MAKKSHISRHDYRQRYLKQKGKPVNPPTKQRTVKRTALSDANSVSESRSDYTHVRLNFWKIFSDRPYISVAIVVLALFFIMAKLWWLLLVLAVIVAVGIFVIAHSHHPDRILSIEFKMKASRKLSMLRALEFGGAIVMFLATYMKQVVTVNFPSAGSTDGLQVVQGILSSHGGVYGQQGSYILGLLNTLTGGQLWGSYRYAANSAQMMNSNSGRLIVMWVLLLMIAPAFCVLAQFFREPYSRNSTLIAAIISTVSFISTPHLMRKWVIEYAVENQMTQQNAQNAVSVGGMAYVAMACAVMVLLISIYRVIKRDKFE
ncbi:cytochrome C5 [Lactobacillus sp. ESL0791]|uniref:cytochrome C5 n=1 Tax=Lactobacillus sp. ESL0791 TaxID=2983234 RepID=UPI0023F85B59|nr:cytochrome C5 [Lactobacillus sp. ESL0791]MDF7638034.1 cytochrome C5 [Lactobacillus sp. ESL0791]